MPMTHRCMVAVQEWFLLNDLKPKLSKSEVISLEIVAQRLASTGTGTVNIAGSQLSFVDKIKSLGTYIDADLSFDVQVNIVC